MFLENKSGEINKGILIGIGIVVLVAAAGGFFWWQNRPTPPEKWSEAEYSKPEDYVVKETAEGKMVENKKAGLSFKVPEGWSVEKPTSETRNFIRLYAPESAEKNPLLMEKGCRIVPDVQYMKTDVNEMKKKLEEGVWRPHLIGSKITQVYGQKALRYSAESQKLGFYREGIGIPVQSTLGKDKVYSFVVDSTYAKKEECIQTFNWFLDTVSIK